MVRPKPDPKYTYHIVTVDLEGKREKHDFESFEEATRHRPFLLAKAGSKSKRNTKYSWVGGITKEPR